MEVPTTNRNTQYSRCTRSAAWRTGSRYGKNGLSPRRCIVLHSAVPLHAETFCYYVARYSWVVSTAFVLEYLSTILHRGLSCIEQYTNTRLLTCMDVDCNSIIPLSYRRINEGSRHLLYIANCRAVAIFRQAVVTVWWHMGWNHETKI